MSMRKFRVGDGVVIRLGYGSNVHDPNPKRIVEHAAGTVLTLESESPSGNVWFRDPQGYRGKIECGEVRNLTRDDRLVELES